MSKLLDKARKQLASGSYEKALDTLQTAQARLRVESHGKARDLEDAHALRDLAAEIEGHLTEAKVRDECHRLVSRAEAMIDELIINVSVKKAKKLNEEKYKQDLGNYIQQKMEISPNAINILTPDAMSRALGMETQLKEKRIVDLRPK